MPWIWLSALANCDCAPEASTGASDLKGLGWYWLYCCAALSTIPAAAVPRGEAVGLICEPIRLEVGLNDDCVVAGLPAAFPIRGCIPCALTGAPPLAGGLAVGVYPGIAPSPPSGGADGVDAGIPEPLPRLGVPSTP